MYRIVKVTQFGKVRYELQEKSMTGFSVKAAEAIRALKQEVVE